jgi:hypothetical protein
MEEAMLKKQVALTVVALFLVCFLAPALHAEEWVFLGESHVDGQVDHDLIHVGKARGRYHALQIRVKQAPIRFERVVVHYGNGSEETLHIRQVIPAGDQTRPLRLAGGDRFVDSLELWYSRANPESRRPEVRLFGMK